jgi:hypothetical protein
MVTQVIDDDKGRKTVILYMKRELIEKVDLERKSFNISFSDVVENALNKYFQSTLFCD